MTRVSDFARDIATALGDPMPPATDVTGAGGLPSVFAVTDLAVASVAAAGAEVASLAAQAGATRPALSVDRRLASFWFAWTLRPDGWEIGSVWDPVAGDYATKDGWIRLHTNAPHHRAAAERVLGPQSEREGMAQAVAQWDARALETAIVGENGCAAEMRSLEAWADHPQGAAVAAEPLMRLDWAPGHVDDRAIRADRPLAGIRILDCTRVLAGPVAGRFLAGFGADVLRIDPPWWEETGVVQEVALGKRCAGLDLREADDRQIFEGLLAEADVFLHGYRGDALEAMGLGFERRRTLNPGLIDVCLDAYGWTGSWAARRGFDSLVQMSAGIAHAGMVESGAAKPTPLPVQALDHATGYLLAAAVGRGIVEKRSTGRTLRARLSLARTAGLLAAHRPHAADAPLAPETADDVAPDIEQTSWGPARRLRAPLAIDGVPVHWDHPATALRSAPAAW